jgi:hypothetical protein
MTLAAGDWPAIVWREIQLKPCGTRLEFIVELLKLALASVPHIIGEFYGYDWVGFGFTMPVGMERVDVRSSACMFPSIPILRVILYLSSSRIILLCTGRGFVRHDGG